MFALDPEKDLDLISANAGNDDRRVQQLRQLLLSQLDLIQKQSEVIVAKDQQLKELRRENEQMQIRVATLSSPTPPIKTGEKTKKTKVVSVKKESIEETPEVEDNVVEEMETEEPYFTLQNETIFQKVTTDDQKVTEKKEEVPGWRLKPMSPSYIMEGTENIEDETILKRHQKPENDEKRRKRLKNNLISRFFTEINK